MQLWPNKLGYDIGSAEVWIHKDAFRVFTDELVLRVPFDVTRNPETALALCQEQGLSREMLDGMPEHEARELYERTVLVQREMF